MTQDKHTPGPWSVEMQDKWPFDISISPNIVAMPRCAYGTSDKSLDDVRDGNSFRGDEREKVCARIAEQEANAHLIAAAPDMLEALEMCYEFIADQYASQEAQSLHGEYVSQEARPLWNVLCAAIAKARGENT